MTSISLYLPVLCCTYGCSLETNISLTESACTNLIHLYKTMWQDSLWNPLPQYCYFTYLKILWLPWMVWKILLTFRNELLSAQLQARPSAHRDGPRANLQSQEGWYKIQGAFSNASRGCRPFRRVLGLLYKEVTFVDYKLRPLGEVGQRELEVVTGEKL